jgi:hypothetical protein
MLRSGPLNDVREQVRPRSVGLQRFLSNLTVLPVVPAPTMHAQLRSELLPRLAQPPAWCVAAAAPEAGPAFGVLCRFTTIEQQQQGEEEDEEEEEEEEEKGGGGRAPPSRLVGMVINLNAGPLTVAVMTRSPQHTSGGLAAVGATELRSGASVRLGQEGYTMRGGQVLVLQLNH